jgi:hypothetical protein
MFAPPVNLISPKRSGVNTPALCPISNRICYLWILDAPFNLSLQLERKVTRDIHYELYKQFIVPSSRSDWNVVETFRKKFKIFDYAFHAKTVKFLINLEALVATLNVVLY